MTVYYNEIDSYCCAWLSNLMDSGLISPGKIDDRSIADVQPDDVRGFIRCHYFAGLGGWDYALQLARWPEEKPIWTGSCPCQPFSVAGKRKGTDDERHLWPQFAQLIGECRPATVFGEQVASKDGRAWLSGVFTDLEGMGYATAAADLCSAGVGAPHIRQRLYWVADTERDAGEPRWVADQYREGAAAAGAGSRSESGRCSLPNRMADSLPTGRPERRPIAASGSIAGSGGSYRLANGQGVGLEERTSEPENSTEELAAALGDSNADGLANAEHGRCKARDKKRIRPSSTLPPSSSRGVENPRCFRGEKRGASVTRVEGGSAFANNSGSNRWADYDLVPCADGKTRRIGTGIQPLAHGVPARMAKLRAVGNSITPQVAADFIRAFFTVGVID